VMAIDVLLFGVSGRLDWLGAWMLTGLFAVYLAAGVWYFSLRDPDLLLERLRTPTNVPSWDRALLRVYPVLLACLFATAAWDAGRGQSQLPRVFQFVGVALVLISFAAVWWCTATNHFLASYARLQSDRGHRVVTAGPYAYVRHPMYTSLTLLMVGIALLLSSVWALVPAAAIGGLFAFRTCLEDRLLVQGLPGYREYAQRVTSRWLPGIW